jgi:hypothetical protein
MLLYSTDDSLNFSTTESSISVRMSELRG